MLVLTLETHIRHPVWLAMAHRYLYYVRKKAILSDLAYDDIEEKAVAIADKDHPIHGPGSSHEDDYAYEYKCMGQYLLNQHNLEGVE